MQSFPKVRLVAVGKIKKSWIQSGIATYAKRVPEVDVVEIKDSNPEGEADKILSMLKGGDRLIALTEEGQPYSSTELADFLSTVDSGTLVFVVGGPDGLAISLKQQAERLLSLSAMTFPHELARLLLIEQLYRAKTILHHGSYHK